MSSCTHSCTHTNTHAHTHTLSPPLPVAFRPSSTSPCARPTLGWHLWLPASLSTPQALPCGRAALSPTPPPSSRPWGLLLGKALGSEFFLLGGTLGRERVHPSRLQGGGWGTATHGTVRRWCPCDSGGHVHLLQGHMPNKRAGLRWTHSARAAVRVLGRMLGWGRGKMGS